MSLNYQTFVLGPMDNNTYLLWDDETLQAVVIDPSFEPDPVIEVIRNRNLVLAEIWLTHAHFDHIAGIGILLEAVNNQTAVLLHKDGLELYQSSGMASLFGFPMPELPKSSRFIKDGQILRIGNSSVEVRSTPGHCSGHVIFYAAEISTAFTGDLIFKQGVGRTDLPGSNQEDLLKSIYTQVLTLPEETVLLSGHGPETTVQDEVEFNPYLN
jgi:glyoxylase-like metal-dependent hydrolase (beta-lactamase superfamily II)